MKNIIKYLVWIIIFGLISCKKNKSSIDYVIIAGEIKNNKSDTLNLYDKLNTSMPEDVLKKIPINKNGQFMDTLDITDGTYMMILPEDEIRSDLYLSSGYNLNINFDCKDLKSTLTFSGDGAAPNNYLAQKAKINDSLKGDFTELNKLEEKEFLSKISQIDKLLTGLLDSDDNLSNEFKIREKNNIHFDHIFNLKIYDVTHASIVKDSTFTLSEPFKKELNDFDYDNEEYYKTSPAYKELVNIHYMTLPHDADQNSKTFSDYYDYYIDEIINKKPKSQLIKNDLLFSHFSSRFSMVKDIDSFYSKFKSLSTNQDHIAKVTEIYNELKKLNAGNPSPKFVNYENHAGGTNSLEDFKGKYVYIDVWATWCGPCKAEIPHLRKVEKEYHDKNIEFVSISVDKEKDYDKWKKMVVDLELGGVQLIADNNFESKFIKEYKINAIPRFILIDSKGKIVKSSAPRPSEDSLIELFDELEI